MEASDSIEMLITIYQTTCHHIAQDSGLVYCIIPYATLLNATNEALWTESWLIAFKMETEGDFEVQVHTSLTLELDGCRCQLHALPQTPIGQEAVCTLEPVWML
jgi:hypothetical protein